MSNSQFIQNANLLRPVVFLDRDGTLNEEIGYIKNLPDLVLIEGAGQSIKKLNDAGVAAILITNQTGAARNYYPESHIQDLHERLKSLLSQYDAFLDAVYYCPHLPEGVNTSLSMICKCRKPAIGLVEKAYQEVPGLDSKKSFVVGDKVSDVELAINCGSRSILVKTGYGTASADTLKQSKVKPDYLAENIVQATDWILAELAQQ